MKKLGQEFFERSTLSVARELLGKHLVWGDRVGKIIETEAYLGPEDLASHARFKSRKRNYLMFGPAGRAYVYFTYGMYHMLNIIAHEEGGAGGILIRAIEGIKHIDLPTDGPGKLTKALGIDGRYNGISLFEEKYYFMDAGAIMEGQIMEFKRIGIDYAGSYRDKPWRFILK